MMKTWREWFYDATVFATIAQEYQKRGMEANAHYFVQRSLYAVAMGLRAATEAYAERSKR